jgi:hypothetical protein
MIHPSYDVSMPNAYEKIYAAAGSIEGAMRPIGSGPLIVPCPATVMLYRSLTPLVRTMRNALRLKVIARAGGGRETERASRAERRKGRP